MDLFGIKTGEELKQENINLAQAFRFYINKIRGGPNYIKDNAEKFNYVKVINQALG